MKPKTINIILSFGLLLFISFLFFKTKESKSELIKSPKFTICKISSDWHSKTTFKGPGYDFEYFLYGNKHQSTINQNNDNIFKLGKRFLFIYDASNPGFGFLIPFYPLSDTIKYPLNGWDLEEVPIDVDLKKIEKYILNR